MLTAVSTEEGDVINKLEERFVGEGRLGHIILCLVPSVLLNKSSSATLCTFK